MIKKGFTLIEVLIVIVILGIIMGIGSVRFRDFARRQSVITAKRQILADVRSVQSDAVSGRKPEACTGTLQGHGIRITGTTGPARYELFARCSSGVASQDYMTKQAELVSDITITTPSVNPILFKPLAEGTNIPAGASATININNAGAGVSESLVIRASGEIR